MNWSDNKKTASGVELHRRLTPETAASCRAAFFKALASVAACLLMTAFGISMLHNSSNAMTRDNGILLALAGITCMLFASVVAYVYFLDWRRHMETGSRSPINRR